jgi:FkbM family methyltransferase
MLTHKEDMMNVDRARASLPETLKREIKIGRARIAELLGSERFSMPGLSGLDRKVMAHLPNCGTFLEVGANDGFAQSNTYYLGQRCGWQGILIEPVPSLYRRCARLRGDAECFNVACVEPGSAGRFVSMMDYGLRSLVLDHQDETEEYERIQRSGAGNAIKVSTSTISGVIDASSFESISFMSVDVEGAELSLLKGLDLSRHTPDAMLIETQHPEAVSQRLDGFMSQAAQLSHHDYLYKRITL